MSLSLFLPKTQFCAFLSPIHGSEKAATISILDVDPNRAGLGIVHLWTIGINSSSLLDTDQIVPGSLSVPKKGNSLRMTRICISGYICHPYAVSLLSINYCVILHSIYYYAIYYRVSGTH